MPKGKRFFNTVGATDPEKHYFLPHRLDWKLLEEFIKKEYYFVLHAPRQSGKTTAIVEFVKHLNQGKAYKALYLSTEAAHCFINNTKETERVILGQLYHQTSIFLSREKKALSYLQKIVHQSELRENSLYDFLFFWAEHSKKPLVLFFDEFDGLVGNSLITLLKQPFQP